MSNISFATSYFYQIRNFKKYMIPVSTAMFDPKWYHDFTGDYGYIFPDKRGILNGIRCENLHFQESEDEKCTCGKGCLEAHKGDGSCSFLTAYRKQIFSNNWVDFYNNCQRIAALIQENEHFTEDPIIVLMVYEVPSNPCSERKTLQDWVQFNGFQCNELKYPIKDNYL